MSEVEKRYGGDADDLDRARERTAAAKAAPRRRTPVRTSEEIEADPDDFVGRMRDSVSEGYDRAQDWAAEGYDSLSRNAVYARRRSVAEFNRGRRGVAAFVEENPIMVGVAGLAAGLLIGSLLPATRRENRYLGPYADDLRREGMRYAKDAAQHGREVVSENLRAIAQPGATDHS